MSIEIVPTGWCPFFNPVQTLTADECRWVIDEAESQGFGQLLSINTQTDTLFDYHPPKTVSLRITDGKIYDLVAQRVFEASGELNLPYEFELYPGLARIPVLYVFKYYPGSNLLPHTDLGGYKGLEERKLNVTIKLNDGYEGGELYLIEDGEPKPLQGKPIGTAAAYPSWQLHGVEAVTSGVRYSMAAWLTGPRFK
jgi:hypothetical protein